MQTKLIQHSSITHFCICLFFPPPPPFVLLASVASLALVQYPSGLLCVSHSYSHTSHILLYFSVLPPNYILVFSSLSCVKTFCAGSVLPHCIFLGGSELRKKLKLQLLVIPSCNSPTLLIDPSPFGAKLRTWKAIFGRA